MRILSTYILDPEEQLLLNHLMRAFDYIGPRVEGQEYLDALVQAESGAECNEQTLDHIRVLACGIKDEAYKRANQGLPNTVSSVYLALGHHARCVQEAFTT